MPSTFRSADQFEFPNIFPQDWAFLARFCFVSGKGRYEYEIEFDRRYGEPQLLLYYDDKSQWPSVYKSDKVSESGAALFLTTEVTRLTVDSGRFAANLTKTAHAFMLLVRTHFVFPRILSSFLFQLHGKSQSKWGFSGISSDKERFRKISPNN